MKLIIGGAYQGKEAYAKEAYPALERIKGFEQRVREQLRAGKDPEEEYEKHREEYKEKVILCEDIFCGIVPMEEEERRWRETLGRVLAKIAKESDEVVRVFCGMGMKLKG